MVVSDYNKLLNLERKLHLAGHDTMNSWHSLILFDARLDKLCFVVSDFNKHELGDMIALDNNHTMDSQHSLILFNARVDKLFFCGQQLQWAWTWRYNYIR